MGSGLSSRPCKEKAAVEVHVRDRVPGLDGFHSPSLPEPLGSSLDCGTIPVDACGLSSEHELQCMPFLGHLLVYV